MAVAARAALTALLLEVRFTPSLEEDTILQSTAPPAHIPVEPETWLRVCEVLRGASFYGCYDDGRCVEPFVASLDDAAVERAEGALRAVMAFVQRD